MDRNTAYDVDVLQWSLDQAAALRAGDFSRLDIKHLADEIEDVGKSEQRDLMSRMGVLLAHLLKWRYQPERLELGGRSWRDTIDIQRERIALALKKTPSLKATLRDTDWRQDAWLDAISLAASETALPRVAFPTECPWSMDQVLAPSWLPD